MRSHCFSALTRCATISVVRPAFTSSSPSRIAASVWVSTAESESSKIITGASFMIALAMAVRWRWPPESVTPRSPSRVR